MREQAIPEASWQEQLLAMARHELVTLLPSRRIRAVHILALLPVLASLLWALFPETVKVDAVGPVFCGVIFHGFLLHFVVFFGCAVLFIRLFRGEIQERCLHYYLLIPLRREVMVAGRYLGAVATALAIFVPTTLLTLVLTFLPCGLSQTWQYFSTGKLSHPFLYLLVISLACFAYGAVFMSFGILFRNPMIPVAILYIWEAGLTKFLPPLLKTFSIAFHLGSLSPLPPLDGVFAIYSDPTHPVLAVFYLLLASGLFLAFSAFRARGMEISYAND